MLKEVSKLLIPAAAMLIAASCGGDNGERDAADSIVAEASAALERGEFTRAEELLDSLSATYPRQIEAGRAALALRPRVMERKTEQEIADLSALLTYTSTYADSLRGCFTTVERSNEVFEPYLIHKDVPANWRERNTAVARLSPSGEFYVISSLAGNSTRHTSLTLSANGVTVTSGSIPFDATDRLSRESVRFPAAAADTLGVFSLQADGRGPVKLTFNGPHKTPTATLSAKDIHAMADTYRMSRALNTINNGNKRLQQLKAKLQLARDHAARTTPAQQ